MSDFVPLTGEPLALDFINTKLLLPSVGWVDGLSSLAGLRLWVGQEQERLDTQDAKLKESDLAAVRDLRDDVTSAVERARHGRNPTQASVRRINVALRTAPPVRQLAWSQTALTEEPARPSHAGSRLITQLAESAADLLTDPKVTSIRECAMEDCVFLFWPVNPRRKWCRDSICGNRARVARHYHRHKAGAST
ncbi:CGNR zinc finger domain-containing protein [Aeromicrobium sp. CTD01-1L150]|uniref:CGNR zinc finger domain-containing protein n=1 Tax=Aeromicrobium sp. CTD01-1L150 TaxID=3341830 RepID=UPI0035C08093